MESELLALAKRTSDLHRSLLKPCGTLAELEGMDAEYIKFLSSCTDMWKEKVKSMQHAKLLASMTKNHSIQNLEYVTSSIRVHRIN